MVGFIILSRSLRAKETNYTNPDFIHVQERDQYRVQALLILSILLLISGLITLFLNTSSFIHLHYLIKVPIYAILGKVTLHLGVAVTFALTISALDLINMVFHLVQKEDAKPVINTGTQVK